MSEYHDVEEIGEKIVEMTDRVKVAHSVLPGSQATWVLEVDDIRFKIVVTIDERTPSPQTNVAGISLTITRALGPYGSAYDPIGVPLRAYTYEHQPGNGVAWNLGCAVSALRQHPSAGDPIDVGLYLLKEMQARGLGVFEVEPKAVEPAPEKHVDAVVKAADDAITSAVFMEYRDGLAVGNRLLPHKEVRARVEHAIRAALATTEGKDNG